MKEKLSTFNRVSRDLIGNKLPEKAYALGVYEESFKVIEDTKKFLTDNPEFSFAVIFNHISLNDPWIAGYVAGLIDPNNSRQWLAPISFSHTELKLKNAGTIAMNLVAQSCGVETMRVVQACQKNDSSYDEKVAARQNLACFRKIPKLKKDGPVGLLICPEGHRSDDGTLLEGEKGVELMGEKLKPLITIPTGIFYDENYNRKGLNIGKKIYIRLGETRIWTKNGERVSLSKIMPDLANTLPMKIRGKWGSEKNIL